MRFLAVILLTAAVASAEPTKTPASIIAQILEAIASLKPEPIAVGPAIVDTEPISVGPAIVDFPVPESVVDPSPVAVIPGPVADVSASAPLVQIIVNINQAAESSPIAVAPVEIAAPEIKPEPVHVVDSAPEIKPEPVHVVDSAPEPVQVVEVAPEPVPSPINPPIAVHPIGVVAPEVEPVQIGVPIIPEAAVVLPEELN